MKKFKSFLMVSCIAAIAAVVMTSCGTIYDYVQVVKTQPTAQSQNLTASSNGYVYEDDVCAVVYNTWSDKGASGFGIYNKSNEILYIDLAKCFFIKNGIAYNYFGERTFVESKTSTTTSSTTVSRGQTLYASQSASVSKYYVGDFGFGPYSSYSPMASSATGSATRAAAASSTVTVSSSASVGRTSGVETKEARIIAIPPQSGKMIENFTIATGEILDCDLVRYPSEKAEIAYSEDNSPLVYANYITYRMGDSKLDAVIRNEFYVSNIVNYPKHQITTYAERALTCPNLLTPYEIRNQKNAPKVYDAYVTINTDGSYYVLYEVNSNSRLYKLEPNYYYWNAAYEGYTRSGGAPQTETANTQKTDTKTSKKKSK